MSTLIFPIAIEPGDDMHAFGVTVPDLPGCFSAGDTLDQALHQAREAIEGHLAVLIEDGTPVPTGRPLSEHRANARYANCIWGVVEVDDSVSTKRDTQISMYVTEEFLRDIDRSASAEKLTRSQFMTMALAKAMGR
ncbi:MAG: type II toxin-antitoxin system HicB family antitoxin [Pseudomonadota bacterium]